MSEKRKDIFRANYVGPTGRHLSCITETTRYGSFTEDRQVSIHPTASRPVPNRKRGGGRIAEAPVRTKGHLAKASSNLDRRRKDQAITMSDTKIPQGTFKVPGSMKWK